MLSNDAMTPKIPQTVCYNRNYCTGRRLFLNAYLSGPSRGHISMGVSVPNLQMGVYCKFLSVFFFLRFDLWSGLFWRHSVEAGHARQKIAVGRNMTGGGRSLDPQDFEPPSLRRQTRVRTSFSLKTHEGVHWYAELRGVCLGLFMVQIFARPTPPSLPNTPYTHPNVYDLPRRYIYIYIYSTRYWD